MTPKTDRDASRPQTPSVPAVEPSIVRTPTAEATAAERLDLAPKGPSPRASATEPPPDGTEGFAAQVGLRRVQLMFQRGAFSEALTLARELAEKYPGFPLAHEWELVLGRCFASRAEFEEARSAYRRALAAPTAAKTESAAMAQWLIGETYFHQRDYRAALREYLRVEILHAYPVWQAAALLQAGKCHEQLGELTEAQDTYRRAIQAWPTAPTFQETQVRLRRLGGE